MNLRTIETDDPRLGMREADLQHAVLELAAWHGWMHYHTFDSRRSPEGFPDLVLVHPVACRTLFVELKSTKGRLTARQEEWLGVLELANAAHPGVSVHVWRPLHWLNGAIEATLKVPGE